jgi:hypothetical protein
MTDWMDPEDLDGAWDRLDHEDKKYVMMWRAVISQSIRDMASVDAAVALEAAVWLDTNDYRQVCELALLEPVSLSTAIREAMESDNPIYRKVLTCQLSDMITSWDGPASQDQEPA